MNKPLFTLITLLSPLVASAGAQVQGSIHGQAQVASPITTTSLNSEATSPNALDNLAEEIMTYIRARQSFVGEQVALDPNGSNANSLVGAVKTAHGRIEANRIVSDRFHQSQHWLEGVISSNEALQQKVIDFAKAEAAKQTEEHKTISAKEVLETIAKFEIKFSALNYLLTKDDIKSVYRAFAPLLSGAVVIDEKTQTEKEGQELKTEWSALGFFGTIENLVNTPSGTLGDIIKKKAQ